MPDLRRTRKNLKTALAIMVGVDLLALAVYVSPLVGSADTRRQELETLQTELRVKTAIAAPLKDLPQKVVLAGQQISDFYKKRLPSQESQVLTELGKLAAANNVTIDQEKYKEKESETGGLEPLEIQAEFAGNYTSLAKFINALERDEMFFIIDGIILDGQPQGPVKLGVKLETYMKAGS
jgi:type IV pilus assembly protein PilO